MPQLQTEALPRYQEQEETDKSKQAQIHRHTIHSQACQKVMIYDIQGIEDKIVDKPDI